jgi:hypothetical protein
MKCFFTTNIADQLECEPGGDFDDNGFPVKQCKMWPCQKYKEAAEGMRLRELAAQMERKRGESE